MFVSAVRMLVAENLSLISGKVTAAFSAAEPGLKASVSPRLVAVSKTKPVEMIIEAYMAGHRDFGENYIQELVDKSHDKQIVENCPDIRYDVPVSFVKLNFSCQMAFHRELSDQQSEQTDDKFSPDSHRDSDLSKTR